jgi:hypothetical protein
MGIDYDAKLICGWEIDYDKLMDYLTQNKVGTCDGYYEEGEDGRVIITCGEKEGSKESRRVYTQCMCGDGCWDNLPPILSKKTFKLVDASPYYDCPREKQKYYVSLCGDDVPLADIMAVPHETVEEAKKFAEILGGKGEAKLMAVLHVY